MWRVEVVWESGNGLKLSGDDWLITNKTVHCLLEERGE